MTPYEIMEHTADVGLRATGETFAKLLADAGEGLFAIIAPGISSTGPGTGEVHFSIDADSKETLLHEWLDTLNVQHQLGGTVFSGFEISLQGNQLRAKAQAQPFDPRVHEPGIEVKAVTWHDLYVRETEQGYEGFALLDI